MSTTENIAEKMINIEVAYATPQRQILHSLQVNSESTIEQAIHASGVLIEFPEIDLSVNKVGIFSKISPLTSQLSDKDRIEIYRPLIADPKEVRKRRAQQGKIMKKGS